MPKVFNKSLKGIWADADIKLSEEDLTETRKEIWANFSENIDDSVDAVAIAYASACGLRNDIQSADNIELVNFSEQFLRNKERI